MGKTLMLIESQISNKYSIELLNILMELSKDEFAELFKNKLLLKKTLRNIIGDDKEIKNHQYKSCYCFFISCYVDYIYYFYNKYNINIDLDIFMDNMSLSKILLLLKYNKDRNIRKYLQNINVDIEKKEKELKAGSLEMHGMTTMQFANVLYTMKNKSNYNSGNFLLKQIEVAEKINSF
jgi:hypothetical protein